MNKKSGAEDVAASKAPSNQDTESDMIIVPSTVESKFTTQQLERAHRTISRAKAWTRENPSAWQRMNELALEDARRGKRVSGSALVEDCRKKDFTDVYGKATRVNNDLAPMLARLISKGNPSVARHVEMRTSIYEEVGY